jgi:hypothetical protein
MGQDWNKVRTREELRADSAYVDELCAKID